MIANVLTIAGSDSGGGAGIQADLKTFSALGAYGLSAITALTAQNTRGVSAIHDVPAGFVAAQLDAVFADIAVHAVKVGMLGRSEVIAAVAKALRARPDLPAVVDPVMVAKGGDRLLREDAVAAVREALLPLAWVLTPNLPEAGVLLMRSPPADEDAMRNAAAALRALGPRAVLVKGGHLPGDASVDVLDDGGTPLLLSAPRVATANTHGTGCTLSSAIAVGLGQGLDVRAAVQGAKRYLSGAIAAADRLNVGGGHGPVHHFHAVWPEHEDTL